MKNEMLTHRNEVLKICARFYTELYSSTLPRPTPLTKEYQIRNIKSPTDHEIRSQENPESNEKQQGPGHR